LFSFPAPRKEYSSAIVEAVSFIKPWPQGLRAFLFIQNEVFKIQNCKKLTLALREKRVYEAFYEVFKF
jgi:hypothetical protein